MIGLPLEVIIFIRNHQNIDIPSFLLKKNVFQNISNAQIATQIQARKKARYKLPSWTLYDDIVFPELVNLEQCTSEKAAVFKSKIVDKGNYFCDITGGFGVDFYHISKNFNHNFYIEKNETLYNISKYNFQILSQHNATFLCDDGMSFLCNTNHCFDLIYVDPSRRNTDKKVIRVEDCEPDVLQMTPVFKKKSRKVMIKLSPMLDIKYVLSMFQNIECIYIISVGNECKELLILLNFESSVSTKFYAVELNIFGEFVYDMSNFIVNNSNYYINSQVKKFIYDPYACVSKFSNYFSFFFKEGLNKISKYTNLFTSEFPYFDFPGRIFEVVQEIDKHNKTAYKVQVILRNTVLSVNQVLKKYRVMEGNEYYLIVFEDDNKKVKAILAKIYTQQII